MTTAPAALVSTVRAFATAHRDWLRACAELDALALLTPRKNRKGARKAEKRDLERLRDSAARRMRVACAAAWEMVDGEKAERKQHEFSHAVSRSIVLQSRGNKPHKSGSARC